MKGNIHMKEIFTYKPHGGDIFTEETYTWKEHIHGGVNIKGTYTWRHNSN